MLGTFDAVLFDFDGTLGDSHEAVLRAYARWADEYGVEVGYAQEYIGRPSATAAHALLPPLHSLYIWTKENMPEVENARQVFDGRGAG